MYKESAAGDTTVAEFSDVMIAQPEDRRDQLLRNDLLDLLTPLGSPSRPRYLLAYKITESISAVFTTRSEEVTRNNLIVSVLYTLHDYESGRTLYSVSISSYSSSNIPVDRKSVV